MAATLNQVRQLMVLANVTRLQSWHDHGLTHGQLRLLRTLRTSPGLATGELAAALGLRSANVTPMLRRLRQRGLVARARNPYDARRLCLALTPAGQEVLAPVPRAGLRPVLAQLTDDELRAAGAALRMLTHTAAAPPGAETS